MSKQLVFVILWLIIICSTVLSAMQGLTEAYRNIINVISGWLIWYLADKDFQIPLYSDKKSSDKQTQTQADTI